MTTATIVDLDAQVAVLAERLSVARRSNARADAELDAARATRDNVVATLTKEFGVATPDEARAKLEQLESELAAEIDALRQALDAMEAQG